MISNTNKQGEINQHKENIKNAKNNIERYVTVRKNLDEAVERNGQRLERMKQIHQTVQEVTNQTKVHIRVYRKLKSLPEEKALVLVETEGFPN